MKKDKLNQEEKIDRKGAQTAFFVLIGVIFSVMAVSAIIMWIFVEAKKKESLEHAQEIAVRDSTIQVAKEREDVLFYRLDILSKDSVDSEEYEQLLVEEISNHKNMIAALQKKRVISNQKEKQINPKGVSLELFYKLEESRDYYADKVLSTEKILFDVRDSLRESQEICDRQLWARFEATRTLDTLRLLSSFVRRSTCVLVSWENYTNTSPVDTLVCSELCFSPWARKKINRMKKRRLLK